MYCDVSDLYAYGLPRGGLPNPGRLVASVDVQAETFTLDEHGFVDGDELTFRPDAIDGELPGGITEDVTYYARRVNDVAFRVSTQAAGGDVVNLTTAGRRFLVVSPLPITSCIAWASRIIDDMLPAHVVPFDEAPEIIRMTCAELAVAKLAARQGAQTTGLSETLASAQARLQRWAKGVPIRTANMTNRANLSVTTAPRDPRGWRKCNRI